MAPKCMETHEPVSQLSYKQMQARVAQLGGVRVVTNCLSSQQPYIVQVSLWMSVFESSSIHTWVCMCAIDDSTPLLPLHSTSLT